MTKEFENLENWLYFAFSNEKDKVAQAIQAMPEIVKNNQWSDADKKVVLERLVKPNLTLEETKTKGLFLQTLLEQSVMNKTEFAHVCRLYYEVRFGYVEEYNTENPFIAPDKIATGFDNIRIVFFEFLSTEFRYFFDLYKTPQDTHVTSINIH